ncbi:MAG TPA: GNAT family N-acetyltransferase, partial [Chromatiaceae bacterium]|nr:GNAT family N-acetyltransferase [Chromatiaceae bacterium]
HAWEEAWQRVGLNYFPKLVSAVPYTPARGARMLSREGFGSRCRGIFLHTARELAAEYSASGVHWLFPDDAELQFLQEQKLVVRNDCQFHWRNRGYCCFDDFLQQLTARKRKNIRRERRKVVDAGVTLRRLNGHTASDRDWQDFTRFYNRLFDEKWGMATFNEAFFKAVARALPEQVLLVLADREGDCIAGALMYASDTTLYGRHWGCVDEIDSLHFEACYYQGIEYCIEKGLQVFEPGAQGEHKVARGFNPVQTSSAHWIAEPGFLEPIRRFASMEQRSVATYIRQLQTQTAYRKEEP